MNADSERINGDSIELERDTDAIREDMNRTLDEIERKLSPGQLLDRSLVYLREHGGVAADAVGRTVRQNPLPVLMAATGLLWTVSATYRSSRRSDGQNVGNRDVGRYGTPDVEGSYGAEEPERSPKSSSAGESIRANVSNGIESAGNRVRNAEQAAAGRIREGATKASELAKKTMQSTQHQSQRAREGFQQMINEQPLTVAAIGIAVGALLSAALPATEWERRAVGQARQRALTKAKKVGEETYDELRDTLRGAPVDSASNHQQADGHAS